MEAATIMNRLSIRSSNACSIPVLLCVEVGDDLLGSSKLKLLHCLIPQPIHDNLSLVGVDKFSKPRRIVSDE
jgi:hypothetical protein